MTDAPHIRDRDATTTLSAGQRDWIRREGRVARALEASQRRSGRRFVRLPPKPRGQSDAVGTGLRR
ncbi:MAG: hypothetical protein ABI611_16025 [Solirubrobacteraceae bacterium]